MEYHHHELSDVVESVCCFGYNEISASSVLAPQLLPTFGTRSPSTNHRYFGGTDLQCISQII